MDRLLAVKLDTTGCEAEVRLNGVPLGRADAARPSLIVPVHEYIVSGSNRLELCYTQPGKNAAETIVAACTMYMRTGG